MWLEKNKRQIDNSCCRGVSISYSKKRNDSRFDERTIYRKSCHSRTNWKLKQKSQNIVRIKPELYSSNFLGRIRVLGFFDIRSGTSPQWDIGTRSLAALDFAPGRVDGGGVKIDPLNLFMNINRGSYVLSRGRTPWPSSPGKYSPVWNPQKWTIAMPISKWVHTRKVQSSVLELT